MKLLVLLCAVVLVSASSDIEWKLWKSRYGKSYETNLEELHRRIVWEANKKYVEEHNRNATTWGFTVAMNEFADMDAAEFSKMYNGYLGVPMRQQSRDLYVASGAPLADQVDWRTKGVVTDIKNQGQCGSCWSFSATGSLEGQHAKKTGKLVSLSEQQLVDCSTKYGNQGCNGGLMDDAFKYIKAVGGDDTEQSYPYTAKNGKCHFNPNAIGATLTGYKDIPTKDCATLKDAAANVGPISVAMDASHISFQLYHSGVYSSIFCSQTKLDHGVLVVGYGTTDSGEDYWIVKNSWGPSWGMKGYFNIKMADNKCGICTQASYPIV